MEKRVNSFAITLNQAEPATQVLLCAELPFGYGTETQSQVPDWVHLLPKGEIRTADGRGPYRFADAARLMALSMELGGGRLVIDENHSTDLAAPKGLPAPAMGWVVELAQRNDGIWGKVEWTPKGSEAVASRAYRGISPVLAHDQTGTVAAILRASLVNKPNLKALATLHLETDQMTLLQKILAALQLPDTTSEDALVTAVTSLHQAQTKEPDPQALQTALQAQLDPVATALGLAAGAKPDAIIAAAATLKTASEGTSAETIVALQSELKNVGTQLAELQTQTQRTAAETFVDQAIAEKRVGVSAMRDRYITMHMADPQGTEELVRGLPQLGPSNATPTPPSVKVGDLSVSLNAEQLAVAKQLGLSVEDYAAQLAVEQGQTR